MKIEIKNLSGPMLDWAFGQIDPQCEGLSWEVRDGVMLGVAPPDLGGVLVFILPRADVPRQKMILAKKYPNASRYAPSRDEHSTMRYMIDMGISVDNMQTPKWAAGFMVPVKCADEKQSPSHCRQLGDTPMQAVARCVVFRGLGAEINVPD